MRKKEYPETIRSLLIVLFLALFLFPGKAFAEGEAEKKEGAGAPVGFTVKALKPPTQIDDQKSFFHFQVRPGEKQTVRVKVTSMQAEPITVVATKTNAFTNASAEIGYTSENHYLDSTLKVPLSDMIEIKNPEVTLENHESKEIEIEVDPQESFSGIKLGALEFSDKKSLEKNNGIENAYGYRIGMMLSEDASRFDEAKNLNLLNVFPTIHRGRRAVAFNFQNPDPQINKNMVFDVTVTKQKDSSFKKELKLDKRRMAPNSTFDLMMNWGIEPIKAGNYTAKVKVVSASGIWEWTESFEISGNQANKLNEEALLNIQLASWIKLLVLALVIFWFLLTGYLLYRRKKWKQSKK